MACSEEFPTPASGFFRKGMHPALANYIYGDLALDRTL